MKTSIVVNRHTQTMLQGVLLLLGALVVTVISSTKTHADDIRLFSGGAPQVVLRALTSEFEKATGHKLIPIYALVTVIQQKLAAGEKADLILLPVPLIAAAEKSVALRQEGRSVLARVGIGMIVGSQAQKPDISDDEAVRKILLSARAIALPEPSTPSGAHLQRMMVQLGIAEQVKPKTVIKAAIDGGGELVAKGEADVGMYLISEVQSVKGVTVVGLLPPRVQNFVTYGSAIPASNTSPDAALAFLKFVSDPARNESWKTAGFELLSGKN